ncbi:MAG: ATP-binding protein [Ignavibacteriales bacterium]|nr:ATP-binding protein [Ignavibacteriales bacterium]
MANEKFIETIFSNNINEITRLGEIIDDFGKSYNLPATLINTINLSLDEIITNTISYGYSDDSVHQILLKLEISDGYIIATVQDDANLFNILESTEVKPDIPLDEKPIGGLGLHLVRTLIDEIKYERKENKNITILKKKII